MDISHTIVTIAQVALGWPLMIYVASASIICTLFFKGIQFRLFTKACSIIFKPHKTATLKKGLTPLQAFVNTLSSNLGNGSIAGMATALYYGGPGATIWLIIFGLILMAVRFAEVYASTGLNTTHSKNELLGGPVTYLQLVPGGIYLSPLYAYFCLLFSLGGGNAIQANSIQISLAATWGTSALSVASILLLFVTYVVCGGAARIIKVSDALVPIKVGLFFITAFIVLGYHIQAIPHALWLMFSGAFSTSAFFGGALGASITQAIKYGMARSIFGSESGLGTAAVLFGSTEKSNALESSLMGMMSTFVSTLVCFLVALCITASGAWSSGLNSTALTVAAFQTVFGFVGGWIVSFLALTFGLGVIITYAYIVRVTWLYITGGRYQFLGMLLYCLSTFFGALMAVEVVWALVDLVMVGMLVINLYGLTWLLPQISKQLNKDLLERR